MSERAEVPENRAEGRSAIRAPQNLIAGLALMAIAGIALWASADPLARGAAEAGGERDRTLGKVLKGQGAGK